MPRHRHFILGTAGHIDHGKSSLVRTLTGTDPDRLPEEKARGMTIELGFASLGLPAADESGDELSIGLIDVPGHADFVKNMVAGVGSIDLALFVVAADDGWMPQTEEHYQILDYLRVPNALVALTKIDLVDELERELVLEDLRENLSGGHWEHIPILPVSSHTGAGIDELRQRISALLTAMPDARDVGKPRLPVDRAFSLKGVGTVVTGTLIDGTLSAGADLVVQPNGIEAHVRNVQSHQADETTAFPATRTALNLSGVGVDQRGGDGVWRGNVVTLPELGEPVTAIDVLLHKSDREVRGQRNSTRSVKTGREVMFHYGSASYAARLHLRESRTLDPGQSGLAELRFRDPVFVFVGDRFILRDASQGLTLAGGIVLDEDANRRLFRKPWQGAFLDARRNAPDDLAILIGSQLTRDKAASRASLLAKSRFSAEEIAAEVAKQVGSGDLAESGPWIFDRSWWERVSAKAGGMIRALHDSNPEQLGLPLRDLRGEIAPDLPTARLFDYLVEGLLAGEYARAGSNLRHRDHIPQLPSELARAGESIRRALADDPISPPNRGELAPNPPEQKALRFLIQVGEVIELDLKTVISESGFERIKAGIIAHLRDAGRATASDLRKATDTSRRILMPLLEKLDQEGVTLRQGDLRTLKEKRG